MESNRTDMISQENSIINSRMLWTGVAIVFLLVSPNLLSALPGGKGKAPAEVSHPKHPDCGCEVYQRQAEKEFRDQISYERKGKTSKVGLLKNSRKGHWNLFQNRFPARLVHDKNRKSAGRKRAIHAACFRWT